MFATSLAAAPSWAQKAVLATCDLTGGQPVSVVSVPGRPYSVISSADGCWLFVSLMAPAESSLNRIAVLHETSNHGIAVDRTIEVKGQVSGMVLTHDGQLLIACAGDRVVFLDVRKLLEGFQDPILAYIDEGLGSQTTYVNVTHDDRFLFVSNEGTSSISVINLELARERGFRQDAMVGNIPVGQRPIALTFSPDGRFLYTSSQIARREWGWPSRCTREVPELTPSRIVNPEGAIVVVDVERAKTWPAEAVISRVPAGCSPVRVAISYDGDLLWVTARNSNALEAFKTIELLRDPQNARRIWVTVGASPVGIALSPDNKYAFVANSNRFAVDANQPQTISVVDISRAPHGEAAVVGTIQAGAFPREFGYSPDGRTLFLSNFLSQSIEVIDTTRLHVDVIGWPNSSRQ